MKGRHACGAPTRYAVPRAAADGNGVPGAARGNAAPQTAAGNAEIARGVQRKCGRWLVMWSAWRQTYTGFACFTREPVIVDEARIERFLERIEQVEMAVFASRR